MTNRIGARAQRDKAWLVVVALFVVVGSSLVARRAGRASHVVVPITTREALAVALAERATAARARCGCGSDPSERSRLAQDLAFLFTSVENREAFAPGAVPRDWSLEPSATARCVRDVERRLSATCATSELPDSCDTSVLTRAPSPAMRVGLGQSCTYDLCEKGLVCVGDEEAQCETGSSQASGGACGRAFVLPVFMP
jgi:hypothetical protein